MESERKIIYPKLSYQIVGCLFEVYNKLGSNHREKFYQKALAQELKLNKIPFREQIYYKFSYKGTPIGQLYFDFLIDNKIILELKSGLYFRKKDFEQLLDYLKSSKLKLGILACFAKDGMKFHRVLNG